MTISGDGFAPRRFDAVVLACHGDQVLPLLAAPTAAERAVFGAFRSTRNDTWLHTDPSILPRRRRAWASWNHLRATGREGRLCLTYHMNRLQPLPTTRDIFVSLNALGLINDATVHARLVYEHPRFDAAAVLAQSRWSEVSGHHRTHYCGAYWMNGFHEDGLNSARRVAAACGVVWP